MSSQSGRLCVRGNEGRSTCGERSSVDIIQRLYVRLKLLSARRAAHRVSSDEPTRPGIRQVCLTQLAVPLESDQVVGPVLEVPGLDVVDGGELGVGAKGRLQVGVVGEVLPDLIVLSGSSPPKPCTKTTSATAPRATSGVTR